MNNFKVVISEAAQSDLDNLSNVISINYKAPATALKYLNGLFQEMRKLTNSAHVYPIQTIKTLQQYGPYPRRVNYKKMAIIYNLVGDVVYIRSIIPSNIISGL